MNQNAGEAPHQIGMADRISGLPDEMKSEIMKFLPAQKCVMSAVYSKTWGTVWRQLDSWDFSDRLYRENFGSAEADYRFRLLVDNVLWLQEGPVLQFFLRCHAYNENNLDRWINTLKKKKLQYLLLESTRSIPYNMTDDFFNCCHLKWLKLNHCTVNPPERFKLPHLKTVSLTFCSISRSGLEGLVSNCPVLEDMVLLHCLDSGDGCVHLKSDKLQTLYISSNFFHVHLSAASLCELKLNLRDPSQDIQAFIDGKCKLSAAKSLGFLPLIETLWLSQCYLLASLSRGFLYRFSCLRELGLYVDFMDKFETQSAVDIIRNCEALDTLVLMNSEKVERILPGLSNLEEKARNLVFCNLKKLHVVNLNTVPVLRFVQMVIAGAPILEEFTFYNLFDNSIIQELYGTTTWASKNLKIQYDHYPRYNTSA